MIDKDTLEARISSLIAEQGSWGWSDNMEDGIRDEVRCISFAKYMEMCLYDENCGYYRSGDVRVGRGGDFYTSAYIGSVMAHCLASAIDKHSGELGRTPAVAEWGAGTGRLSRQLLDVWSNRPADARPTELTIIEDHPRHREEIRSACALAAEAVLRKPLQLLRSDEAMEGNMKERFGLAAEEPLFIIANELVDAMPVHRVMRLNDTIVELGVAGNAEAGFRYVYMKPSDDRLAMTLELDGTCLLEGQVTEIALAAVDWLEELGKRIAGHCRLILIDYGHEADEYASPHRMNGTLLCYSGHMASDSPFERPGSQDLTAHVPFTALRRAAEESGWETVYYDTQKQFLIDNGALELLQNDDSFNPFSETAKRNRAVRQLLLSDGMSESFKVLVLAKHDNP
ncbi:class I SAM-dependent methyltransferase [Paenibacillus sp. NEAU-GSW1]|uniref:class I SAM-dependent methyltransferase n=1 Tax=Paenibacillus sp. NEAU-GSW1 TaxID=2682486 RepID=UPI0012E20A9C|nr:SAM-dependent methyltransferase [Paenibacillus sp. NEAU-GSW1]MUT66210.1 SAM-dependent methyltransferase [Paenibacillus sp. NEAU-GSW1]